MDRTDDKDKPLEENDLIGIAEELKERFTRFQACLSDLDQCSSLTDSLQKIHEIRDRQSTLEMGLLQMHLTVCSPG